MNTYSKEVTKSVVQRLQAAALFVYLLCIIAGAIFGATFLTDFARNTNQYMSDEPQFGVILPGLVIGGLLGYVVGYLQTTLIDWMKQVLLALDSMT